jgi:hypothetical protein
MHHRPHRTEVPALLLAALAVAGCSLEHQVDVKPTHHTVKIEPIHMTVDINLRVQKELDAFYDDVEQEEEP